MGRRSLEDYLDMADDRRKQEREEGRHQDPMTESSDAPTCLNPYYRYGGRQYACAKPKGHAEPCGPTVSTPDGDPSQSNIVCLRRFDPALGQMVFEPLPEGAAPLPTTDVLDWLGGLLHDEGNLLLSRIPYPDGAVVSIGTYEGGDGPEVGLAQSAPAASVTAGLREAIAIAVHRVPVAESVNRVSDGEGAEGNSPSRTRTYDHSINRSSVQGSDLAVQSEASNGLADKIERTDTDLEGSTEPKVSIECQEEDAEPPSLIDEPELAKMEPAPEAQWRERMRLILTDPDEHCPGSVYLSMALRTAELERRFVPATPSPDDEPGPELSADQGLRIGGEIVRVMGAGNPRHAALQGDIARAWVVALCSPSFRKLVSGVRS